MTQPLTIVCKLQPSDEQVQHLDDTLEAFAAACNWVHETVPLRIRNKDRMQAMVYYEVRERFGLSANLAIQAIRRVCMNRKAAQTNKSKVKSFDAGSIQYDARIFSFRESDWTVSLTLLSGRERFAIQVANYQKGKLTGKSPKAAQLCRHPDGTYAVHIQIEEPTDPRHPRTRPLALTWAALTLPIPLGASVGLGKRFGASVIGSAACGPSWSAKLRRARGARGGVAVSS